MNAGEILGSDLVDQLDREGKVRLLLSCGVALALDIEDGAWSAKVHGCTITSPNPDDVIEIALGDAEDAARALADLVAAD